MTPSVDNLHKFAMPAISVMQPLNGAALIKISYEFSFIFLFFCLPIVNNGVLSTSYFNIFLSVVVFVSSHSSIPV